MSRPGSIPDSQRIPDSLPPPPEEAGAAGEIDWLKKSVRHVWKALTIHAAEDAAIHGRLVELEESLGVEGSAAKGRPATGLHLALEVAQAANAKAQKETVERFEVVHREVAGVAALVREVAAGLASDRAERAQLAALEVVRTQTVERARAPWVATWGTARTGLIAGLVALLLSAASAYIARHWATDDQRSSPPSARP